jgi:hypothetical protein
MSAISFSRTTTRTKETSPCTRPPHNALGRFGIASMSRILPWSKLLRGIGRPTMMLSAMPPQDRRSWRPVNSSELRVSMPIDREIALPGRSGEQQLLSNMRVRYTLCSTKKGM